jgi:ABC-type arginine transport system ATPase subunit
VDRVARDLAAVRGIMRAIRDALASAPAKTRLRLVCYPQRFSGTLIGGDDASADLALARSIPMDRRIVVFDITEEMAKLRPDFAGALAAQP